MGLKDELLKKANSGTLGQQIESQSEIVKEKVNEIKEEIIDDSIFSKEDEGSFFQEEKKEEPLEELDFDSIMNDTIGEVSYEKENSSEEVFVEEKPAEKVKPVQKAFQQEVDVSSKENPTPTNTTQSNFYKHTTMNSGEFDMKTNYDAGNTQLEPSLLKLAKKSVLEDIDKTEDFISEVVTAEAFSKFIQDYLNDDHKSKIKNSNIIFSAVIDEAISKGYQQDYYQELTKDILESIKADLQNF